MFEEELNSLVATIAHGRRSFHALEQQMIGQYLEKRID
jgi:hypothetical protein